MKYLLLALLLGTFCVGCALEGSAPTPSPTQSLSSRKLVLGQSFLKKQKFEEAAVTLREALDLLEKENAPAEIQEEARKSCTIALKEAGGFTASRRLWKDMGQKPPGPSKEGIRMLARAEKMMRMQGDELVTQASEDLKGGAESKASATLEAAIELYEEAGQSEAQLKVANKLRDEIVASLLDNPRSKQPTE